MAIRNKFESSTNDLLFRIYILLILGIIKANRSNSRKKLYSVCETISSHCFCNAILGLGVNSTRLMAMKEYAEF